jgi:hypothetical protein
LALVGGLDNHQGDHAGNCVGFRRDPNVFRADDGTQHFSDTVGLDTRRGPEALGHGLVTLRHGLESLRDAGSF